LLGAASIAAGWPDQTAHASLAHEAAGSLESAGLPQEAERTYLRAADLWRQLGITGLEVRATRARAWLGLRRAAPDWSGALALMDQAAALCATPDLVQERWETQAQIADLLLDWPAAPAEIAARGLAAAEAAASGFAGLDQFPRAAELRLTAADFEVRHLGRREAAAGRLLALRSECLARGVDELVRRCDEYLSWLASSS
jgi:hypothetical protein